MQLKPKTKKQKANLIENSEIALENSLESKFPPTNETINP